jgi:phosphoribosyl-dephospho-CoA transferase
MNAEQAPLPHDLCWGMPVAGLPADAPAWVVDVVQRRHPVVVRRALAPAGQLAVGVRGPGREQRYATFMGLADVRRSVRPEQLGQLQGSGDAREWPALQALAQLRPLLNGLGVAWGVSGSAGFELASGVRALHPGSDLDLIVRTPRYVSRQCAARWLQALEGAPCRVDVQLQTPRGGVALRDWAGTASQVLLKGPSAAELVVNPWPSQEIGP